MVWMCLQYCYVLCCTFPRRELQTAKFTKGEGPTQRCGLHQSVPTGLSGACSVHRLGPPSRGEDRPGCSCISHTSVGRHSTSPKRFPRGVWVARSHRQVGDWQRGTRYIHQGSYQQEIHSTFQHFHSQGSWDGAAEVL